MPVQRLQTVENAFRVLEALAEDQPAGTTALARRLGMDKNAVQRILTTLGHIGWIDPVDGPATGWQLSARVVSLAQRYAPDLRARARAHLEALADATGETVALFARDGVHLVVIDAVDSTQPLRMTVPLGTDVLLTDKISTDFLAFLAEDERTSLLGSRALSARRVAKLRAQGYYVVADAFPDVVAVGSPITSADGGTVGGIYVIGPARRMTADVCRAVGVDVARTAALSDDPSEYRVGMRSSISNSNTRGDTSAEYDVVVIGAGYGGVSAAALLAHAGRKVALVDKTPRAGGKTQTLPRKGYRYEMFGAVGIPAAGSRFHELVDVLDIGERAPFSVPTGNVAGMHYKTKSGEWRSFRGPAQQTGTDEEIENLRRVFDATDQDLTALGEMFGAVFSIEGEDLDVLDDVGMLGWLRTFNLSEPLLSQWCGVLNMLFVVPVNRLAASEAILTMKQLALGGSAWYHVGGYGRVAEVCAEYVTEHQGAFLTSERVTGVIVEGGRAVGVETASGVLRARAVVSNAGIQPTVLKLAGAEHFPVEYVERVRALEPSWAIAGVRYILDEPVLDAALIPVFSDESWLDDERFARMERGEWPDVPMMAIDVPSVFDDSLTPVAGHQIAISQVFTSPDPTSPMMQEAIRRSELAIEEVWPGFGDHVIRREPYGVCHISRMTRDSAVPGQGGEAVGLAQVVGQCGRSKPDPCTPLPGLYLVGCDAGGRGAGTHQAVDSGFNVSAMVDAALG